MKRFETLSTSNKITLKEAYDMYKKQNKFVKNLEKAKNDKFDIELLKAFNFIFNLHEKQSVYEKLMCEAMQYVFWELVILGGKIVDFDFSASLLKHSFNKNPDDLYITEGNIIEEIKSDNTFINEIQSIIQEHEQKSKNTISIKKGIRFGNKDLFFSINNATMTVEGVKNNDKWNLKINIFDIYDYTKLKTIKEYYKSTDNTTKSVFSSTLYNFAYFSMKANVLNEFNIYINFEINNY